MENTERSIDQVDQLLKKRGYDINFCLADRIFGDFSEVMKAYVKIAKQRNAHATFFPVDVYTYINFTESNREDVRVNLKIDLDQLQQIKLSELKISNIDIDDTEKATKKIRIKDPIDVPTKKEAIAIGIKLLIQKHEQSQKCKVKFRG